MSDSDHTASLLSPEDVKGQYASLLTIVELAGGAFVWLAISRAPYDYQCVRGKHGNRWAAFALLLPCRYLSVLAVFSEIMYGCTIPLPIAQAFGKAAMILRFISVAIAFAIFFLCVNTLWKNNFVWALTMLSQVAFWVALCLEGSRFDRPSYAGDSRVCVMSIWLYLSTVVFASAILGVLSPQYRSNNNARRLSRLAQVARHYRDDALPKPLLSGMASLAICWLTSVVGVAVFLGLKHWHSASRRTLCYVLWLVIVHTACQQYERLARRQIFLGPPLPQEWVLRVSALCQPRRSMAEQHLETDASIVDPPSQDKRAHAEIEAMSVHPMDVELQLFERLERQGDVDVVTAAMGRTTQTGTTSITSRAPTMLLASLTDTR